MTEDTIFTKIIKGEIPSYKLYENEHTFSFLDIMPGSKGHALVIPKTQVETVDELSPEEIAEVIKTAKKVGTALKQAVGCEGYNLLINNGPVAGQTVNHVHMHIIPRHKDDGLKLTWDAQKFSEDEMKGVQENVKKFLE